MDISNTWEEIKTDFNASKYKDLIALSIMLRNWMEKHLKKNEISDFSYSAMHSLLHVKTMKVSKKTVIRNLYEITTKLPLDVDKSVILNSLKENSIDLDFTLDSIDDSEKDVIIIKNIYIVNKSIISLANSIFYYVAYFYDDKMKRKKRKVTFFSSTFSLEIYKSYLVDIKFMMLNNKYKRYFIDQWKPLTIIYDEWFKKEFNRDRTMDIKKLITTEEIKSANNPAELDSKTRKLIRIVQSAEREDFDASKYRDLKKYLPKSKELLNASTPSFPISSESFIRLYNLFNEKNWFNKSYIEEWINLMNTNITNDAISKIIKYPTNAPKYGVTKYKNKFYIKEYLNILKKFSECFLKEDTEFRVDSDENGFEKLNSNRSILVYGPAGHGKTHRINDFFNKNKNLKWGLLAPSWKALSIYNKNSSEAYTVQKINKSQYNQNLQDAFCNDFFDKLDVLVVDEISMIGDWFFLNLINKKTKIIFSGDNKQIPPVSSRNQASKWLYEIAKKNKAVIDVGKNINYRLFWKNDHEITEIDKEFKGIEKIANLLSVIRNEKFNIKRNNEKYIELLCFVNNASELIDIIENKSKEGYRIITKNNFGIFGNEMVNIFAGQDIKNHDFSIGDIISFTETDKLNKYYNQQEGEIKEVIINDDIVEGQKNYIISSGEREITLSSVEGDEPFKKAKAISAHRAQGSSIPKVLVIVDSPTTYRWLYSAASRAAEELIIVIYNGNGEISFQKEEKMEFVDELFL